jgi:hypothetical protein
MVAVKLKGHITPDRKLSVNLPEDIAPGEVEVILLHEAPTKPVKAPRHRPRHKEIHPAFGIWADRTDIIDSARFAAQLRHRIQNRKDARG